MRMRVAGWSGVRDRRWRSLRYGITALIVVLVGGYAASIVLYAGNNAGRPSRSASPPAGSRTTVTMDLQDVESNYSVLMAYLTVSPGPALLDPQTHHLKEDFSIRVRSVTTPIRRTWTKGMLPGVFPVPLTLAGQVNRWPFDQYQSGPVEVDVFSGAATAPDLVTVAFVNHIAGWRVDVSNAGGSGTYRLRLDRSLSTAVFALVILGVLVLIAGLGAFVAVQTLRNRRPFQPPMTTWYAAMLFAVVPLRNALPGPPFGSWIDVTVVLPVIVLLVLSMLLYIVCWWRHLKPQTGGAASPS